MGEYTESKEFDAEIIYGDEADDEDNNIYSVRLFENAKSFRTFDKALCAFILEHGYVGDPSDKKAMTKFLRTKFEENNIDDNVRFSELFVSSKRRDRKTAFRICFALNLTIEETNDFFRRVMLERGIDCHAIEEVVYYFCIRNRLSYSEARGIIECLSDIKKRKEMPKDNILYTETVVNHVDNITEKENLILYIENNRESFEYKNATAIRFINNFWEKIIGAEGIAVKEGRMIEKLNLMHHEITGEIPNDNMAIKEEVEYEEKIKNDDYVVSKENSKTWIIYSQIMGLDNKQERRFSSNRSLETILKDNELLPITAYYCFPSRQTIDEIIRGESHNDYEKFRKVLILFTFYTYWAKIVISNNDIFYCAKFYDRDKCRDYINMYLKDAGYPELYAGNPYDWIFLWSMNDEHPLEAFRAYMREVYIAKSKVEE